MLEIKFTQKSRQSADFLPVNHLSDQIFNSFEIKNSAGAFF
jgi:hypothetical protein